MSKVSLSDIAKEVGVSKTTVSVVLNNKGNHISYKTRERILAIAKKWNYRPNRLAKGLSIGKSNMIGLIVSDLSNIFYSIIAKSVEQEASALGYEVLICSSNEDPEKEVKLLQMFRERQIDGVIISSTQKVADEIRQLKKENYPFVLIDRAYQDIDTNYVLVDSYQGAYDAVRYLTELGYQRIGMITTLTHISSMQERSAGYHAALNRAGLFMEDELVHEVIFRDMDKEILHALETMLHLPDPIDALFITNNKLAASALKLLRDMEIRIPDDIAFISFDDVEAFNLIDPPITAIRHPAEEIGRRAVRILVNELNQENGQVNRSRIKLPVELVIRASCEKADGHSFS